MARLLPDGTETRRVWLVGCPGANQREWSHCAGERVTHSHGSEAVSGAQWARRVFVPTGNASIEIYMRSTRLFENAFLAWLWRMNLVESGTHGQAVPLNGAVVVRGYRDDDPSLYHEYIMRDAVVELDPMGGGGKSLEIGCNFKGPRVLPYRTGYTSVLTVPVRAWAPPVMYLKLPARGSTASENALPLPPADELNEIVSESVGTAPSSVALGFGWVLRFKLAAEAAALIETDSLVLKQWAPTVTAWRGPAGAIYNVFADGVIAPTGSASGGYLYPNYTLRDAIMSMAGVLPFAYGATGNEGPYGEDDYDDQEEYIFTPYPGIEWMQFGAQRVTVGAQDYLKLRVIQDAEGLMNGGHFTLRVEDSYTGDDSYARVYETLDPLVPARLLFGGKAFSADVNVVNVDD